MAKGCEVRSGVTGGSGPEEGGLCQGGAAGVQGGRRGLLGMERVEALLLGGRRRCYPIQCKKARTQRGEASCLRSQSYGGGTQIQAS